MTWFISTSDIIGAIIFTPLLVFAAAVFTAASVFERFKLRGRPLAMWAVFIAILALYSSVIGYGAWRLLS